MPAFQAMQKRMRLRLITLSADGSEALSQAISGG
jgi:hypothetical protein